MRYAWMLVSVVLMSQIYALPVEQLYETEDFNVTGENTVVKQRGGTASYQHNSTVSDFARVLDSFNTSIRQWSNDMYTAVENGSQRLVQTERRMSIYRVTSIYDNVDTELYATKKTLTVAAPENRSVLYVVERPGYEDDAGVVFQKDPWLRGPNGYVWRFENGTTRNITYYIPRIVVGNSTAVYGFAPVQEGTAASSSTRENQTVGFEQNFAGSLPDVPIAFILEVISGIFALLIVTTVVFELETTGKLRGMKDFSRDAIAICCVGFRNKRLIDDYIQNCLDSGHHPDDIHIQLIRAGWNRRAVRTLLKKYR